MYRVLKEEGYSADVVVENTDTKANVRLSRDSYFTAKSLLSDAGYKIPGSDHDAWDIEVNKETAQSLVALTMRMKKPIRDQSKKPKDLFKKPNKEIDAMDVLLGLASYS